MKESVDLMYLNDALTLAKTRRGFCAPNPSVGAVIVRDDQVIATGVHEGYGMPHAEINALQAVSMKAHGATLYVSLEPCCHWGKTPPCTDALIQSGIKRVVYGYVDPNSLVNGGGQAALQAAGVMCDYAFLPAIHAFYESYYHWQVYKRPFITAKIALSLNGMIAGSGGEPLPITGSALQAFTHYSRQSSDAILTTQTTIQHDNPRLNARYQNQTVAKPLYILDSSLRLSPKALIFNTAASITLFHEKSASLALQHTLTSLGARCIAVDTTPDGLDLNDIVQVIGHDGIHDLWIEAGGRCFASFWREKLLQRGFIYIAPRWFTQGRPAFTDPIALADDVKSIHWRQMGDDVLCEMNW